MNILNAIGWSLAVWSLLFFAFSYESIEEMSRYIPVVVAISVFLILI